MAFVWARVDQKLIHGQISVAWVPYLSIDAIVVADSDLVDDIWAQKVMTMGLPSEVSSARFTAPGQLVSVLGEDKYQSLRVMVIFKDIAGALEAMASGLKLVTLNLGNQSRKNSENEVCVCDTFYAQASELKALRYLQKNGLEVVLQAIPAGRAVRWKPEAK